MGRGCHPQILLVEVEDGERVTVDAFAPPVWQTVKSGRKPDQPRDRAARLMPPDDNGQKGGPEI